MKTTPLLAPVLALVVAGCGGKTPPNTPDTSDPSVVPPSSSVSPQTPDMDSGPKTRADGPAKPAPSDPAPNMPPPPVEEPALTDEQILQVTHTANQGELEQAKLAQSKAKDPRVKKLAAMMLKEHGEADAKGTAVAKKANLALASSSTSTALEGDAKTGTNALQSLSGSDFDKGYVDTQVKEHQAVLDLIDKKLVPAAKNADVKAFVAEVRPKIAMHLQHAQELQKALTK